MEDKSYIRWSFSRPWANDGHGKIFFKYYRWRYDQKRGQDMRSRHPVFLSMAKLKHLFKMLKDYRQCALSVQVYWGNDLNQTEMENASNMVKTVAELYDIKVEEYGKA